MGTLKGHKAKKAQKRVKPKPAKVDGLSPGDVEKIRRAIRQVWSWSHPRRLCIARAMGPDGFPRCENPECEKRGKPVPKVFADHINRVGDVDGGFIGRLFCSSRGLQALCKKCHDKKTKQERDEVKHGF